jgi:hypothetical protein
MNATALTKQAEQEEADAWDFIKSKVPRKGTGAVALAWRDLHTHNADILHDEEVEAVVHYRSQPDSEETQARLPLQAVHRLRSPETDAEITHLGAPSPQPIRFYAMATTRLAHSSIVTMLRDRRGIGFPSLSDVKLPNGQTEGRAIQQWAQRSGVPNQRLDVEHAIAWIWDGWGLERGEIVVTGARCEAIIKYFASAPNAGDTGCIWTILRFDDDADEPVSLAQSPPPEPLPHKRLYEVIADAIKLEAYGAKDVWLPRARAWTESIEMGAWEAALESDDADPRLKKGRRPTPDPRIQAMSDFTLWQRFGDPTGDLAAALADGTVLPERLASLGADAAELVRCYSIERVRELVTHERLTETQARYVAMIDQDYSRSEVAKHFGVDKSAVSRALSTAAKNFPRKFRK